MKKHIINALITASNTLNQQAQCLSDIKTFPIDCSKLKEFLNEDIRDSADFRELFEKLQKIKGPCVYWYEILQEQVPANEILQAFKDYRDFEGGNRTVPALRSEDIFYSKSNVLYVGKAKREFYGRVMQHLGCHKHAHNQGLQLFYWAKKLNLKLQLHVIEFDYSMENLLPVIELAVADNLKPLIGKHK